MFMREYILEGIYSCGDVVCFSYTEKPDYVEGITVEGVFTN